jgi:hypothetical protein
MRFELTTLTLARLCSTPELRPHPFPLALRLTVSPSVSGDLWDCAGGRKRKNHVRHEFFPNIDSTLQST